jgi:hypothetical protein
MLLILDGMFRQITKVGVFFGMGWADPIAAADRIEDD